MSRSAPVPIDRPIVMVGMMGAGKSAIGRRLAARLAIPFVDADEEIEAAAGCSIQDIFDQHGETVFRDGERRVIARLLETPRQVIATGGGAYMDPQTRRLIAERGTSVWLRATLDVLWRRVRRRSTRPLLQTADPKATLARLIDQRYPVYSSADVIVDTVDGPPEETVDRVIEALGRYAREHADDPRPRNRNCGAGRAQL